MASSGTTISRSSRTKLIIGAVLLLAAVVLMVVSATQSTAEFFMTVEELQRSGAERVGENLRVSGAVIGETIAYDSEAGELHFTIAHIPANGEIIESRGGIAAVLHQAALDPEAPRLRVIYKGAPPDMLKDEAQAILTGTIQPDGSFFAEELLLKCPSRYEEALPEQVDPGSS